LIIFWGCSAVVAIVSSVSISPYDTVHGVGMDATAFLICSTADLITEWSSVSADLSDNSSAAMVGIIGAGGALGGGLWPVICDVAVDVVGVSLDVSES